MFFTQRYHDRLNLQILNQPVLMNLLLHYCILLTFNKYKLLEYMYIQSNKIRFQISRYLCGLTVNQLGTDENATMKRQNVKKKKYQKLNLRDVKVHVQRPLYMYFKHTSNHTYIYEETRCFSLSARLSQHVRSYP